MSESVKLEKLYGERLWILTMRDNSRQTVDEWEATVRAYNEHMNSPQRYLIYDTTSVSRMSFTGYMRERATVLAKENADAVGRVALIARIPYTIRYIIDLFIQFTNRRVQPKIEVRVFAERDEALKWVAEILPAEANVQDENSQSSAC
jgi:hypothetical protein